MSENEFMEMTSDDVSFLTLDEAKGKIDSVMREARSDPKHAYLDGGNPDHKKAVEVMRQLHEAASPQTEPQTTETGETLVNQYSPETLSAMKEGMEIQEGKHQATQEKLFTEGEQEMDALEKLGFERDNIPSDIAPYQVRALKEQRLHAEATDKYNKESWDKLGEMLTKDFKELNSNAEGLVMLNQFFTTADPSDKLAAEISHTIMKHIYDLKKG